MRALIMLATGLMPAFLSAQPPQQAVPSVPDYTDEQVLQAHIKSIQDEFARVNSRLRDLEQQRIRLQQDIRAIEQKLNQPRQASVRAEQ